MQPIFLADMKTLLRYCILTLIVFCLNLGVAEALGTYIASTTSASTAPGLQFTTQYEQTTKQAISNFYDHCPEMTCDMVSTSQDIPVAKYIIRHAHIHSKSDVNLLTSKKSGTHLSSFYFSDPVSYYIFGLKKIVI